MESRSVIIEEKKIVYNIQGEGPLILFLHGNLGSRIWFEKVMDLPGFTTAAPDLPNFGDSGRITSTSPGEYGRYASLFLKTLFPRGAALVVGHSLGGAVAMETAFRESGLVERLLLVDSCPVKGLKTPVSYHPIIEQYKTDRDLLKKALASVAPALEDDSFLDRLTDQARKMAEPAFIGHAVELGRVDYRRGAKAYTGPVTVIRGALDGLITREMAEETASAFSQGRYVELEGVGHSVMVENPLLFKQMVRESVQ